jgi:peptidoglycan hydrolase-like protein with peptidoglycan-binding domain
MTRYAKATWRPLRENSTEPLINATQCVFHTAVTKADSLWGYFQQTGVVVESHGYIQQDGDAEQYIDYDRQADAQAAGNARAISWETWDNADPEHVPWNDKQLARLVDIAVDLHRQKHIPLRRCRSWTDPGFGGHRDFKEWNPNLHSCPGTARSRQIAVVLDRARAIVAGVHPAPVVPKTPVPAKPGTVAPRFPLAAGYYFGPKSGPAQSVSGYYSHRADLKVWQARMAQRGWKITVDGLFDSQDAAVATAFQREKHLSVDGRVGPATWNAAWSASVTK